MGRIDFREYIRVVEDFTIQRNTASGQLLKHVSEIPNDKTLRA